MKILLLLLTLTAYSTAWAANSAKGKCDIVIEDVGSGGAKYKLEQTYSSATRFRKSFKLPGTNYSCTHAFFGLEKGTMLSCELDELGHHFIQSDRTSIDESKPKNNLNFRYKTSFFVIKTDCYEG